MRQPTKDTEVRSRSKATERGPEAEVQLAQGCIGDQPTCLLFPDPQYRPSLLGRKASGWSRQLLRKALSVALRKARVVQREAWREGRGGQAVKLGIFAETFYPRLLLTAKGSQFPASPIPHPQPLPVLGHSGMRKT